jgi:hypothetical protein
MSERGTIYVALLDEGVDVWRPVEAKRLSTGRYLIVEQDYDPAIERWEFEPGTIVKCRRERRDGGQILVATEAARRSAAG